MVEGFTAEFPLHNETLVKYCEINVSTQHCGTDPSRIPKCNHKLITALFQFLLLLRDDNHEGNFRTWPVRMLIAEPGPAKPVSFLPIRSRWFFMIRQFCVFGKIQEQLLYCFSSERDFASLLGPAAFGKC